MSKMCTTLGEYRSGGVLLPCTRPSLAARLATSWPHLGSWPWLGPILAHLEPILAHPGPIFAHLGAIFSHLGLFLAHLGAILAPS